MAEIAKQQLAPRAEVQGQSGAPGEGPYMFVTLQAQGDVILDANFSTYGCPYAIACGNWLTGWVKQKTVDQAALLGTKDLSLMLGGLPLGKEHCAQIAVEALQDGLAQLKG